jgi:hypothetical protein
MRASAPDDRSSLAAATEAKSKNIRAAVAMITEGLESHAQALETPFHLLFAPRWRGATGPWPPRTRLTTRAAWNLVGIWLLAQASGQVCEDCTLADAEAWFLGSVRPPFRLISELVEERAIDQIQHLLIAVPIDNDFWDLLPYVLEEHGPGSRASVMRDPATAPARAVKRKEGTFYTPSDVADYIVRRTMGNFCGNPLGAKCLDPACGTGVFLLALLRAAQQDCSPGLGFDRLDYVARFLYGCDISSQALDACAFVLLLDCLSEVQIRRMSPWAAWHLIRLNLVDVDALTLEPPSTRLASEMPLKAPRLAALRSGLWLSTPSYVAPELLGPNSNQNGPPHGRDLFGGRATALEKFFPDSPNGFEILVGNPPFATLGDRSDSAVLARSYHCLAGGKAATRENTYPLFVEMMWRLTVPGASAAGLVTPLSIAFHRGDQFEACREAMMMNGGRWQFAFFDRQPHALFGEEVKTRNAILFRFENPRTFPRGKRAEIDTGPLRKWTSRTRRLLFQRVDFTSLGESNITSGVPKLHGEPQARAFIELRNRLERLPSFCARITTCAPAEAFKNSPVPRVFVGGTAYNFLNVYQTTSLTGDEYGSPLSESSIHCFEFRSEADAQVGFAILSSRLVFWLWHVLGDGFHVAGWLFGEIPFGRFTEEEHNALAALGRRLWHSLQKHRFLSLNGGKQTIGFRPLGCNEERDAIDLVLVRAAGLPLDFVNELRSFVRDNTIVDGFDERRTHLRAYFTEHTTT